MKLRDLMKQSVSWKGSASVVGPKLSSLCTQKTASRLCSQPDTSGLRPYTTSLEDTIQ
jgi:hypothetical protein